jgi:hypothetical protein
LLNSPREGFDITTISTMDVAETTKKRFKKIILMTLETLDPKLLTN